MPDNSRKAHLVDGRASKATLTRSKPPKHSSRNAPAKGKPTRKQAATRKPESNDFTKGGTSPVEIQPVREGVVPQLDDQVDEVHMLLLAACARAPPEKRPSDLDERVAQVGYEVVDGELFPKPGASFVYKPEVVLEERRKRQQQLNNVATDSTGPGELHPPAPPAPEGDVSSDPKVVAIQEDMNRVHVTLLVHSARAHPEELSSETNEKAAQAGYDIVKRELVPKPDATHVLKPEAVLEYRQRKKKQEQQLREILPSTEKPLPPEFQQATLENPFAMEFVRLFDKMREGRT